MGDRADHLHEVLGSCAQFLQDKNLAMDKHQPYLVRWVRDFLLRQLQRAKEGVTLASNRPCQNLLRSNTPRVAAVLEPGGRSPKRLPAGVRSCGMGAAHWMGYLRETSGGFATPDQEPAVSGRFAPVRGVCCDGHRATASGFRAAPGTYWGLGSSPLQLGRREGAEVARMR